MHTMQNWFALSDPAMPAMDEALHEIASMRLFAHLALRGPILSIDC